MLWGGHGTVTLLPVACSEPLCWLQVPASRRPSLRSPQGVGAGDLPWAGAPRVLLGPQVGRPSEAVQDNRPEDACALHRAG